MSRRAVLDAEAVVALLSPDHGSHRQVLAVLEAARRLGRDVAVANVTLAELYRSAGRTAAVDGLLAREREGLLLRDTDRSLARLVGGVLAGAGAGSEDMADAHAVAVAVEAGGGLVVTGDPSDLTRLAEGYANVIVVPLGQAA